MSGRQSSRGLGPVPDLVPLYDEEPPTEQFTTVDIGDISYLPTDPEQDLYLTGVKSEQRGSVLSGPIHPMTSSKATWIKYE